MHCMHMHIGHIAVTDLALHRHMWRVCGFTGRCISGSIFTPSQTGEVNSFKAYSISNVFDLRSQPQIIVAKAKQLLQWV